MYYNFDELYSHFFQRKPTVFVPGGGVVGILKAGADGSSFGISFAGAGLSAAALLSVVVSFGGASPGNRFQVNLLVKKLTPKQCG